MKNFLKKERFLVDIFLFGSVLKGKEKPNDVDLIALFRERSYEKAEDILYKIKKIGEKLNLNLHIDPVIIDNLHNQKVYISLLHEGFSIKNNKFLNDLLGFKSFIMITYNLISKSASDKVRFSYALYGRKEGEGLLKILKGKEIGRGSIFVPVNEQEAIKSFFRQWNVDFKEQRVVVFE